MLRQLRNLTDFGRIRTAPRSTRRRKPAFLKQHPKLEIQNVLEALALQFTNAHDRYYFVQIGAFDGKTGDPLFELIQRYGWQGVLVEPQIEAFKILKQNYQEQPHLKFYNVAVGPHNGELEIYVRESGPTQNAGVRRRSLITPNHKSDELQVASVPCWTLQKLLEEAEAPETIDLLQIDAEGYDYEIIKSIDFDRCKPKIIRYEHICLSESDKNRCLAFLSGHGYRFILDDADTTSLLEPSLPHAPKPPIA